jgi:hypothetical protein
MPAFHSYGCDCGAEAYANGRQDESNPHLARVIVIERIGLYLR